ncbi:MAG TPA: hypothetical protein PLL10_08545, partial [Elusimicrobiales bacterium]|nr:hypothetical protein [Elusimicrobiales bacterium]
SGLYIDTATEVQHSYTVSAVDRAGNEGEKSAVVEIIPDATPPPAPVEFAVQSAANGLTLTWQPAPGETIASYRLYRATATINSIAGLSYRVVSSPVIDAPETDSVYHYVLTAIDLAGNESLPTAEVSSGYDKAPPVITISGVSANTYYNHPVAPIFSAQDYNLDPNSVHALLNNQPFASGTQVSDQGNYTLSVFAADAEAHASTSTISFVIDTSSPVISVAGVAANAAYVGQALPVLSASDGNLAALAATLDGQPYVIGSTVTAEGAHTLNITATDKAGNTATHALSFTISPAPAKPAALEAAITDAGISFNWQKPNSDTIGYRVYKDGALVSAGVQTDPNFTDTAYTSDAFHVYEISAVDSKYQEGPKARISMPPVSLNLSSYGNVVNGEQALNAGFFDTLRFEAVNKSTQSVEVGACTVEAAGLLSSPAQGTTLPANASVIMPVVIYTSTGVSSVSFMAKLALPCADGTVYLQKPLTLAARAP